MFILLVVFNIVCIHMWQLIDVDILVYGDKSQNIPNVRYFVTCVVHCKAWLNGDMTLHHAPFENIIGDFMSCWNIWYNKYCFCGLTYLCLYPWRACHFQHILPQLSVYLTYDMNSKWTIHLLHTTHLQWLDKFYVHII